MSRPKATLGDGYPIQPGDGVTAFALHLAPDNAVFLRPIRRAHLLEAADVAVVQADNFLERVPAAPLMNLRAELSTELPMPGAPLVTTPIPKTLFSISTWAVRYPRSGVTTSKEDSCASCARAPVPGPCTKFRRLQPSALPPFIAISVRGVPAHPRQGSGSKARERQGREHETPRRFCESPLRPARWPRVGRPAGGTDCGRARVLRLGPGQARQAERIDPLLPLARHPRGRNPSPVRGEHGAGVRRADRRRPGDPPGRGHALRRHDGGDRDGCRPRKAHHRELARDAGVFLFAGGPALPAARLGRLRGPRARESRRPARSSSVGHQKPPVLGPRKPAKEGAASPNGCPAVERHVSPPN